MSTARRQFLASSAASVAAGRFILENKHLLRLAEY